MGGLAFLLVVAVCSGVFNRALKNNIDRSPPVLKTQEDSRNAEPVPRKQRKELKPSLPTEETKGAPGEHTGQPTTAPPSAPTDVSAECEVSIQDESPEHRKAVANAEAACSKINAEHIPILTKILAENYSAGKTRAGSMKLAKDWCRQENLLSGDKSLDGPYEGCISALSKTFWTELSVPATAPPVRENPASQPVANMQKRTQDEVGKAEKWKQEEAKQPQRKELIQGLIDKGVFSKVEYRGPLATIWVASTFYLLDFETKQSFASVVYAYIATNEKDEVVSVTLKDARSGKTVGEYGWQWTRFGLKME